MKRNLPFSLCVFFMLISCSLFAQQAPKTDSTDHKTLVTREDSLEKNLFSFLKGTTIGGYGNVRYTRNFTQKNSLATLERFVLFIGHKFSSKISLFSELELENAKIEGGKASGEFALEQAYLKFNINPNNYIVAGLFLPRIGILNENHLPTSFNGNERTIVETFILPSTWREIGFGYYGTANKIPLTYFIGLMNGLNAQGFEHGSGIREGRYEGSFARMNSLALSAAIQYNKGNFKAQLSGYYGGSVGAGKKEADSVQLKSGIFGTPVAIITAHVQYAVKGFQLRILGSYVSIADAAAINRAYASNTPESEYGVYGELAYNILEEIKKANHHQLIAFVRYEKLDMNASIPDNGITDGTLRQEHIVAGLSYLPIKNVIIKVDVRQQITGNVNPDLVINPNPAAQPYPTKQTMLSIGVGYSF